jgi:hypothetical protein
MYFATKFCDSQVFVFIGTQKPLQKGSVLQQCIKQKPEVTMQNTATALLIAVQYIESRSQDGELDDDVAVLEAIAAELQEATEDEKTQLKLAAQRMGLSSLLDELGI